MDPKQHAATWGNILLAAAGLVCVTVLAAMGRISGDFALVAIVSILGAGGVNTFMTFMSTVHPKVGGAPPTPAPTQTPSQEG